jgi:hypothetical protein
LFQEAQYSKEQFQDTKITSEGWQLKEIPDVATHLTKSLDGVRETYRLVSG